MPNLITSEAQLRAYIPNIIASVKGETPLIERIAHFLDLAESWVKSTFTGEDLFISVCNGDLPGLHAPLSALVIADAMRRAIPSLDVMLTPNGFAVVNTSNLVPASKPRIDRLTDSMLSHRDDCISTVLKELPKVVSWCDSYQAHFFAATLFPDLAIVDSVGGATGSKWDRYLELRQQVIDQEASLAEEWLSPELMAALRSEILNGMLTVKRSRLVREVKAQIVGFLRNGSFNSRRLADIVNYIRLNADDFKEWHASKTAELFSPPVFRNTKASKGYFF